MSNTEAPKLDLQRLLDRPLDPAELEIAAQSAAIPAEAGARTRLGVLTFRIAGEALAIPAKSLRRITTHAPVVPIPHRQGKLLRGLCNVRGELVLCMDLASLLGLSEPASSPPRRTELERTVVLGPADAPWAFQADELHGVERIDPAAILTLVSHLSPALQASATGCFEHEARAFTLLDPERIMQAFAGGVA